MARPDPHSETLTRADGTPIRILTVDDEPSLTELLSMAMRYEGWEVSTAGSGLEAVKAARDLRLGWPLVVITFLVVLVTTHFFWHV